MTRTPAVDRLVDAAGSVCRLLYVELDALDALPSDRLIALTNETRDAIKDVLDESGGVMGMTVTPL